jgi:exonuclease I
MVTGKVMADVCDALVESAKLLRGIAAQNRLFTHIWLAPEKHPVGLQIDSAEWPIAKVTSVFDLATRLEGGAAEIRRVWAELARIEGMARMQ